VDDSLELIVRFLGQVGIVVREGDIGSDAFLPGVAIHDGSLVCDRRNLLSPGDLLHEAGHIAVTPACRRAALNGALDTESAEPYGGETEAIAWSWAALVHLQLPAEILFHEQGYRGQSPALALSYTMGVYPGAHGLAQAGMTRVGTEARRAGLRVYPHMLRWLRA
jgi:hypothetical protein